MRFLVVDDSPTMRRIMNNALMHLGFEEVIEATDGRDAMAKLASEEIDFIITDWNMPNMNGLELTRAVREDESYNELPILMVTTRNSRRDVLQALEAQVSYYITKPFTSESLQTKIQEILKKMKPA